MPASAFEGAVLFTYAFLSNVALAVVPHEPVVIWYGARNGVLFTTVIATAGTAVAAWIDHRAFVPLIRRWATKPLLSQGFIGTLRQWFARAPFAVLMASGLLPLPFFPFKAVAFANDYPLGRYISAVALGRLPRYALLAWLGVVIEIPGWILIVLFLLMVAPSLRLAWKTLREK